MFKRIIKKRFQKLLLTFLVGILALISLFPLILTVSNSFMSESEIIKSYFSGIDYSLNQGENQSNNANRYMTLKFIPDEVVLKQYYTVLIKRTQFLFMFWNSVLIVVPIIIGQMVVAAMAAYAFSKFKFRGRDFLFFIYIVTMLMPFQVTLVPNFLVADRLGLIGSGWSIIFPGIFGAFGVFLLRQFMRSIPDEYLEAARVDGASPWQLFYKIVLPITKPGLAALGILVFVDNWNMVEQPLIFLQDPNKIPLSIFLSNINSGERGIAFAAAVIYMAPLFLVFLYGENYLIEGIQLSGIKG